MKRLFLSATVLFMFILFAPYGVFSGEALPRYISIGTHPVGAYFNTVGTAAAKTISDHTKMKGIPKPMAGPTAWLPYMERGEIGLGVLNVWDAEKAYMGESIYKTLSRGKAFSVGLVCVTTQNLGGLVVAKDSGIKSYADLKGKRVGGNFPTPSLQAQVNAYLANGNVKWSEVTPIPVNSVTEGVKVVMDGRADASGTISLGTGAIAELDAKKGARILPINVSKEAVARTKKFHPGHPVKVKPSPANVGILEEQYLWAYDIYLIAGNKVSEEAVYQITKALWENYKEFEKVHYLLKDWNQETFVTDDPAIPYHPGAIRFYKEKGLWTKQLDQLQQKLLQEKPKSK